MGNYTSSSTAATSNETTPVQSDDDLPSTPRFKYEKGVCALEYWDPIACLEQGSISDIHLVRRRQHRVLVRYKEKRDIMKLTADKKCLVRQNDPTCCRTNNDDNNKSYGDEQEPELFVLKSIMKDHVGDDRVLEEMRREIYTMSHLDHPNVVKLYEAYERRRHIYLVMEYCPGGNLAYRFFTEHQVAVLVGKILGALAYLHSKKVVHRDIKLENIMLDAKGDIKIIDFGLATKYLSEEYQQMTDRVGTLYSMAPEVIWGGPYTSKCDLWSTGVVTYLLLSHGKQPFWGPPQSMPWVKRRKIMMERIVRGEYMPMDRGTSWEFISAAAKTFCARLLQLQPDHRPTAEQALKDPWILVQQSEKSTTKTAVESPPSEDDRKIALGTRIMARIRQLLVSHMTAAQVVELRHEVEQHDAIGEGWIPLGDFRNILEQQTGSILGSDLVATVMNGGESCSAQQTLDMTAVTVEYVDFFAHVLRDMGRNVTDRLAKALDDLDLQGTRKVHVDQLRSTLKECMPADVTLAQEDELWKEIQVDDEGQVATTDVLELVGKKLAMHMRDSMPNCSEYLV